MPKDAIFEERLTIRKALQWTGGVGQEFCSTAMQTATSFENGGCRDAHKAMPLTLVDRTRKWLILTNCWSNSNHLHRRVRGVYITT